MISININKKLAVLTFLLFSFSSWVAGQDGEIQIPEELAPTEVEVQGDSTIEMGFTQNTKRNMVGAVSAINPSDILEYDNNQSIGSLLEGRVLGLYGSGNVRGLGDAMVVIDGIPGRPLNFLNSEEIEQITVLRDASAVALYGSMGRNGVIVVTTKRGKRNVKKSNVNVSYGINDPISMPNYLGSAEYMQLFNEARMNDGLGPQFTEEQINNFANSDNRVRFPSVDLYSDQYLRSFTQFANAIAEFSGGTENTQFYVNLGYTRNESLVKLNPEANAGSHRFNLRGNINFKVNDWIKSSLDVVSVINTDRSSRSNLLMSGTERLPHTFAPLLPISMMDTANNGELKGIVDAANKFDGNLLGATQAFQDNTPIAQTLAAGYVNTIFRTTQVNNSIDIDLGNVLEGLSAKTFFSFDFYNLYTNTIENRYALYEPTWSNDTIVGLNRIGDQDVEGQDLQANGREFFTRYGFYGMLNYDKLIGDKHQINASLIGFANNLHIQDQIQTDKNAHLAMQLRYTFDNKLLVDLAAAYVNSAKLPEDNRTRLSPSIGLGYLLSESPLFQNVNWLDYLKVKGSAGIIYSDIGINRQLSNNNFFLYNEIYREAGGFGWADGANNNATVIEQGGNPNLGFESRQDINLGLEAILFDDLWLEINAFQTVMGDQVTLIRNQYPSFYEDFIPYANFNEDRYRGLELGLNYMKNFGDFQTDIGFRATYVNSERTQVDEAWQNDYQFREGNVVDALWGLEDLGFYTSADFDENGDLRSDLPASTFGEVQPGDIKYKDQNGDMRLDNQDEVQIGRWQDPFIFNTTINLNYKGLNLFVLGLGQFGSEEMLNNNWQYNNYYTVDGNDKYSEVVRNRWTEETAATATFPRLSSQANNNNFRNSTFWAINNSFFRLQRVQLTYSLPTNFVNALNMNYLSIFASGSNLLELAENREERQLRIGGMPMFRSYAVGLRAKF